jgi:uncharacterized membrane protein
MTIAWLGLMFLGLTLTFYGFLTMRAEAAERRESEG